MIESNRLITEYHKDVFNKVVKNLILNILNRNMKPIKFLISIAKFQFDDKGSKLKLIQGKTRIINGSLKYMELTLEGFYSSTLHLVSKEHLNRVPFNVYSKDSQIFILRYFFQDLHTFLNIPILKLRLTDQNNGIWFDEFIDLINLQYN